MYATRSPSCSPPAPSDQFCLERITYFAAPKRTRFCLCQSTFGRGHSFTVAQLPRLASFCVESQRVHACTKSSSVRVAHVDHSFLRFFHHELVAKAFKHDNQYILQNVLHENIQEHFNLQPGILCVKTAESVALLLSKKIAFTATEHDDPDTKKGITDQLTRKKTEYENTAERWEKYSWYRGDPARLHHLGVANLGPQRFWTKNADTMPLTERERRCEGVYKVVQKQGHGGGNTMPTHRHPEYVFAKTLQPKSALSSSTAPAASRRPDADQSGFYSSQAAACSFGKLGETRRTSSRTATKLQVVTLELVSVGDLFFYVG